MSLRMSRSNNLFTKLKRLKRNCRLKVFLSICFEGYFNPESEAKKQKNHFVEFGSVNRSLQSFDQSFLERVRGSLLERSRIVDSSHHEGRQKVLRGLVDSSKAKNKIIITF